MYISVIILLYVPISLIYFVSRLITTEAVVRRPTDHRIRLVADWTTTKVTQVSSERVVYIFNSILSQNQLQSVLLYVATPLSILPSCIDLLSFFLANNECCFIVNVDPEAFRFFVSKTERQSSSFGLETSSIKSLCTHIKE